MRFDIATLFPELCDMILAQSILGRAAKKDFLSFYTHQIREYSLNKHRNVDDVPYGGGKGMLMTADPIYRCYEDIVAQLGEKPHTIYMSPQGAVLTQKRALELSLLPNVLIICGHYEGVDERIIDEIVDEEISVGDYVLTGGELPAMVLVDAVARLCEGVLADPSCYEEESHFNGLLEYPQYTRPEEWRGKKVPEILLSGHHANIERWRREEALRRTFLKRPDLLAKAELSAEDRFYLKTVLKADLF